VVEPDKTSGGTEEFAEIVVSVIASMGVVGCIYFLIAGILYNTEHLPQEQYYRVMDNLWFRDWFPQFYFILLFMEFLFLLTLRALYKKWKKSIVATVLISITAYSYLFFSEVLPYLK